MTADPGDEPGGLDQRSAQEPRISRRCQRTPIRFASPAFVSEQGRLLNLDFTPALVDGAGSAPRPVASGDVGEIAAVGLLGAYQRAIGRGLP